MIPASDFIGRISHRPLAVKVRRNLVKCAGVDACGDLRAYSCPVLVVGCGAPDRKYRCDACKREQKRRWDAQNQRNKTKQETEAPLTPADRTDRGFRFRELDALIAESGENPGNWRGQYRPDWEFTGGISATPLARVEYQDVSGRRTGEKHRG